jgi:hypothetical protein
LKIVGLCVYYDESPAWLTAGMASFAPLCDAFVYVDGAYALFPGSMAKPNSPVSSAVALAEVADSLKRTLVHYRSPDFFTGNEVEKRQLSLDLAKTIPGVDGDSWFAVFDSDYMARHISRDIRVKLMETDALVAENLLFENYDHQATVDAGGPDFSLTGRGTDNKIRNLVRNIPELKVGPAHYVYSGVDPDTGKFGYLWGNPLAHQPYAKALDLTAHLKVEHRRLERTQGRNQAAAEFYRVRDRLKIESIGDRRFLRGMDGKWKPVDGE